VRAHVRVGHDLIRRVPALADVAEVAHSRLGVEDTARAITERLVPALVDFCLIDLIDADGNVQRLAGALDGDQQLVAAFLARPPSGAGAPASAASTVVPRTTQHIAVVDDDVRRRLSHDDEDFRLLQRLAIRSAVNVPLVARERQIGVLTLASRSAQRPIDERFAAYAETLAGRVALTIDNVRLAEELADTERQMQSILATADAGVMVRDTAGRLVFANQAAADLLKLPDAAAVRAAGSAELMALFDVYTEEGDPVALADLPGTRVLRGEPAPPPLLVRNVVRATGEERWLLNKATAITDDSGRPRMAVNLVEDVTEIKRAELAQRLLATAARQVDEAGDLTARLQTIADALVPAFADWASVDLLSPGRRIDTVAVAHRDPKMAQRGWHLRRGWPASIDSEGGIAEVIRTGRSQVLHGIDEELLSAAAVDDEHRAALQAIGLKSTMIVPLVAGGEVLGALSFVSSTSRRFDDRDLRLAEDLGRQVGVTISAARLNEAQAEIAHTLQLGLRPERLPEIEGWRAATVYRPAGELNEAGGDFFDALRCGNRWAIVIGDVVGKGAEAAAITALVRHTLAATLTAGHDVPMALSVLNERLRERSDRLPLLCTLATVVLSSESDEVTVYCAGHPLPLLDHDGELTAIGRPSPILGSDDVVHLDAVTATIAPGDRLLLYTDGVLDALGPRERYGEHRLRETLLAHRGAGDDPPEAVLHSVEMFLAGAQTDDIAIVGLTRMPVAAAASPS